jgi:hypothetical protein
MMNDFLSDAGWLFFAGWSIIIGVVVFAAFAGELIPTKKPTERSSPSNSSGTAPSTSR